MELDYRAAEHRVVKTYRIASKQYRRDDELEVRTRNHRRLAGVLADICTSFAHPIKVLDVGCGTGRYFHCLRNAQKLTGLDVSDEMLAAARKPVFEEQITVPAVELLRGNAHLRDFAPCSFDFIYSLGMFGYGCPFSTELCERFFDWLVPGGKLFFNTLDFAGLPVCHRAKKWARGLVFPFLTSSLRQKINEREQEHPLFAPTRKELSELVARSRFRNFTIRSEECLSPLGRGRHLECFAVKE